MFDPEIEPLDSAVPADLYDSGSLTYDPSELEPSQLPTDLGREDEEA